jgi:iron complex outermembrane receptor protein
MNPIAHRSNHPQPRRLSALIHAAFMLPVLAGAAGAQAQSAAAAAAPASAASQADDGVQSVTVIGVSASLRSAVDAKNQSNSMVEVIASEDIGKLPDTTIAESLARLPGLAAGIDRGNASQLEARGLGPRFIGSTLNGREFATTEPDRAVRFEMFPSESISGAKVYKTQSAELVEGGIATTVDLQTISPLAYKERSASIKADAEYYKQGADIEGAKKVAPRLGAVYVDQFADHTIGVALAASYFDQPDVSDQFQNYGFNGSTPLAGTGTDAAPWGFQNQVVKGTNKRTSMLGKVEWKPNADTSLTADAYSARSDIHENSMYHVADQGTSYSDVTASDGFVTGGTAQGVSMNTIEGLWKQDQRDFAVGLNGKTKVAGWKLEGDVARSTATRDTLWAGVGLWMQNSGTLTWSAPHNGWATYSFSEDTGNPDNFGDTTYEQWGPNYAGKLTDSLNSQVFSASHDLAWGGINKVKVGVRATEREKYYNQISWDFDNTSVPLSTADLERVHVSGRPDFVEFAGGLDSAITKYFGADALSTAGRSATDSDLVNKDWRAKENNTSAYVQFDLSGDALGKGYRGDVGLRVAHTDQTGYGYQQVDGGAPALVSDGLGYTRFLPSLNLVLALDEAEQHQLRFGASRAMSRAPLDVMNDAHVVTTATEAGELTTVTGGNPRLKPMMANQLDLAYEDFFDKASLLSAGVFFKQITDYIALDTVQGTYNGQAANFTEQVNRTGGHAQGFELVYQQAFNKLPGLWGGLGVMGNYTYTNSNIKDMASDGAPIPTNGLMKHNMGATLWYEHAGFEARLSANHHSQYNRAPTWDSTQFYYNGAETWASLNLSQQITSNLQARFGIENLTNQRVIYTDPTNRYNQWDFQYGRRFDIGLTYKL